MYEKLRALASRRLVESSGIGLQASRPTDSLMLRGRIESDNAIMYAMPKFRPGCPVPVCPRLPRGMAN